MQELIVTILLTVVIIMAAALLAFVGSRKDGMTKKQRVMMTRILIASVILLVLQFISAEVFDAVDSYLFPSAGRWIRLACYLIDYFIIGYDILRKAVKGIKNRQVFDELLCIGAGDPSPGCPHALYGAVCGLGCLDLPGTDLPCYQLPLCAGDQYSFEFLCGNRRRKQRGCAGKRFQLSGNPFTDQVCCL